MTESNSAQQEPTLEEIEAQLKGIRDSLPMDDELHRVIFGALALIGKIQAATAVAKSNAAPSTGAVETPFTLSEK